MTVRSRTLLYNVRSASVIPAWLASVQPGQWGEIAGGSGATAVTARGAKFDYTVAPFQSKSTNGSGNVAYKSGDLFTAWSGAAFDPVRKEFLVVALGGDAVYDGNEGYALALNRDVPAWYRLNNPTGIVGRSDTGYTNPVVNGHPTFDIGPYPPITPYPQQLRGVASHMGDGRSGSMHCAGFPQYVLGNDGKGRVWFPGQAVGPITLGVTHNIVAFNRDFAGMPHAPGEVELAWDGTSLTDLSTGTVGPWEMNHGLLSNTPYTMSTNTGSYFFGTGDYDSNSHRIWTIGSDANGLYTSVDPLAGGASYTFNNLVPATTNAAWLCACPNEGVIIRGPSGSAYGGTFRDLDIMIPTTTAALPTWFRRTPGGGSLPLTGRPFVQGIFYNGQVLDPEQAVYYKAAGAATGSIYFMPASHYADSTINETLSTYDGKIYKLTLPAATAAGLQATTNADWANAWSEITPVAGSPVTLPFQTQPEMIAQLKIVQFGSAAALLRVRGFDKSVYFYRIS